MKSLFVVDSPLQLLNAIEARHHFDAERTESVLVVMQGASPLTLEQTTKMIDPGHWSQVHVIPGSPDEFFFPTMRAIDQALGREEGFERAFIGEYRSPFMRHAVHRSRAREVFLLDDGTVSLLIDEMIKRNAFRMTWKDYIKRFFFGFRVDVVDGFKYFTVYNIKPSGNHAVVSNTYAYLRSRLSTITPSAEVYFLGSNLVEFGIMAEATYLRLLVDVQKYFGVERIVYLPHRRETDSKLDMVRQLGFDVRWLPTCVEYDMCFSRHAPRVLAAFVSSALVNCHQIFGEVLDVRSFFVDSSCFRPPFQEEFSVIYEYYRSIASPGFQVVELPADSEI